MLSSAIGIVIGDVRIGESRQLFQMTLICLEGEEFEGESCTR